MVPTAIVAETTKRNFEHVVLRLESFFLLIYSLSEGHKVGLIAKRKRFKVGGLSVVIRLMTLNVGFYKRYGTVVIVRALRRKRKKANLRVVIQNDYFRRVDDGRGRSVITHFGTRATRSSEKRRTRLSEFAIGQTPDFGVVGVFSQCVISANGEERLETVSDGEVPEEFVPGPPPRI